MFSPMAHLFGMDHPGYKEPWSYGEEAQRIFKKYDRLRYRMIPYIYSEAWNMHNTGMPMMRALVLEYQDDINVYDISDQYLFGRNLLVAPVTTKGAQTRTVYLPEGTWYHYWSGKEYEGKSHYNIVTPLEELPIFVRAGGIIPKRNNIDQLGEAPADTLTLEIFPGGNSSYDIYDDDGTSKDYEQGEYALTEITSQDDDERTVIAIHQPEGQYDVPQRSYKLQVHSLEAPKAVQQDGQTLDIFNSRAAYNNQPQQTGWYYDAEASELLVRTDGTSEDDIQVTITK